MRKQYKFKTHSEHLLADTLSPVAMYARVRHKVAHALLLESSEYGANDNSFSYICFNPIAQIRVQNESIFRQYPDGTISETPITDTTHVTDEIHQFAQQFQGEYPESQFINNGLFGYISYEAVRYFEDIKLSKKGGKQAIPDIYYAVYQNVIAVNLFNNEAMLFCHSIDGENNLEEVMTMLKSQNTSFFPFKKTGEMQSNMTDQDFIELVKKGKQHCQRGDVFQLVLSRRFSQQFEGDTFQLYRALRTVNPSPYLFYFDYGDFKILGSSPEAQLVVKHNIAEIHPIAGTFRRTGNKKQDALLAEKLLSDPKENSEHVMLVDLARNDLSRHGNQVNVENYREVQYYSHVIHLVSKVTGHKKTDSSTYQVVADTFPAGTLSGAPKHRAMQLIDEYENVGRSFYGGAIGFMDFSGNFNHAIIIRSFLSLEQKLYLQAGAGIVTDSVPENEMQEVYNKIGALTTALEIAEKIQA